jgi:hypothetical protein
MSNLYRAMCAELLVLAEESISYRAQVDEAVNLIDRARALLAQPLPEGLTDGELDEMERRYWKLGSSIEIEPEGISEVWDRKETFDHRAFARAAISAACAARESSASLGNYLPYRRSSYHYYGEIQ